MTAERPSPSPADPEIFEAEPAQLCAIVQISSIENDRLSRARDLLAGMNV
jgi:hypothetical protein